MTVIEELRARHDDLVRQRELLAETKSERVRTNRLTERALDALGARLNEEISDVWRALRTLEMEAE